MKKSKRSRGNQLRRPQSLSIASLLEQPSPWSDWMENKDIAPLSSWRLAAVLLRELPVETVINRIAPALMSADVEGQKLVVAHLHDMPMPAGIVFGFEHWLDFWSYDGRAPYEAALGEVLTRLDGSPDIRLFAEVASDRFGDMTTLLWFLLGAVQSWALWDDDDRIDPAARWLVKLYADDPGSSDPLALLFAYFYERFRASGGCETQPLPEELAVSQESGDFQLDDSARLPSTEDAVMAAASIFEPHERGPSLLDVLSIDPRSWPESAGRIASLRKQGLMSSTRFALTPVGRWQMDIQQDEMRSQTGVPMPEGVSRH